MACSPEWFAWLSDGILFPSLLHCSHLNCSGNGLVAFVFPQMDAVAVVVEVADGDDNDPPLDVHLN